MLQHYSHGTKLSTFHRRDMGHKTLQILAVQFMVKRCGFQALPQMRFQSSWVTMTDVAVGILMTVVLVVAASVYLCKMITHCIQNGQRWS